MASAARDACTLSAMQPSQTWSQSAIILATDTAHLDTSRAQMDLSEEDDSWMIDRLTVTSPLLSVQSQGSIPPTSKQGAWVAASVDVAALAKQLPATLHLRDDLRVDRGAAHAPRRRPFRLPTDTPRIGTSPGNIADLAARQGQKLLTLPDPARLDGEARADKNSAETCAAGRPIELSDRDRQGRFRQRHRRRGHADLAAFRERFRDWIDLGESSWPAMVNSTAAYRRHGLTYQAGVDASFQDLHLGGLPLVGELERNQATFSGKLGGDATAGWLARIVARIIPPGLTANWLSRVMGPRNNAATGNLAVSGRAELHLDSLALASSIEAELNATSRKGVDG